MQSEIQILNLKFRKLIKNEKKEIFKNMNQTSSGL